MSLKIFLLVTTHFSMLQILYSIYRTVIWKYKKPFCYLHPCQGLDVKGVTVNALPVPEPPSLHSPFYSSSYAKLFLKTKSKRAIPDPGTRLLSWDGMHKE